MKAELQMKKTVAYDLNISFESKEELWAIYDLFNNVIICDLLREKTTIDPEKIRRALYGDEFHRPLSGHLQNNDFENIFSKITINE